MGVSVLSAVGFVLFAALITWWRADTILRQTQSSGGLRVTKRMLWGCVGIACLATVGFSFFVPNTLPAALAVFSTGCVLAMGCIAAVTDTWFKQKLSNSANFWFGVGAVLAGYGAAVAGGMTGFAVVMLAIYVLVLVGWYFLHIGYIGDILAWFSSAAALFALYGVLMNSAYTDTSTMVGEGVVVQAIAAMSPLLSFLGVLLVKVGYRAYSRDRATDWDERDGEKRRWKLPAGVSATLGIIVPMMIMVIVF